MSWLRFNFFLPDQTEKMAPKKPTREPSKRKNISKKDNTQKDNGTPEKIVKLNLKDKLIKSPAKLIKSPAKAKNAKSPAKTKAKSPGKKKNHQQ